MATSRRVGNYATSANAVIRNSDAIFDAAMSGKPDFTAISKEAIKGRSLERRAVTKAEADVASAGLKAFTDVNLTRMAEDTKKEIANIKRPAKRMAGIVGGLGAIAGGYVMMEGNKKDKAEREALKAERDALTAKQEARWAESDRRLEEMMNRSNTKDSGGEADPKSSDPVPSGSNTSPPATPASASSPSPKGGSTKFTPTAGTGKMSAQFKKIYDLAVKDGRSKFPEIVAAQAMHETGYLSPKITSVYNSSGGTNPFGQTGDRGYGTITRKGDSNGWSKFPDLQTAVSDHITLWHDTGNHSENYNAYSTVSEGLSKVIPAYSPNSDPANQSAGYTESGYSAAVKKILRDNGFDVK